MANPWDNDPIYKPLANKAAAPAATGGNPWDNDPVVTQEPSTMQNIAQGAGNLAAGLVRGAGSIGATLLAPYDMAKDALAGKGLSLESNRERRQGIDDGLQTMGAQPDSALYKGGKVVSEVAGTLGVGGALANGVRAVAPGASAFTNALATSGMRAGEGGGAINMLTRAAGGAVAGGAASGLINPDMAGGGAVVGALLPPAITGIGKVGSSIARTINGPEVPASIQNAVSAARDVGYVIPPSQAKPTLANRALEGFSGKITTAQNASARNQPITNELAKKAIGASELSPEGLAQVRTQANKAYDALGQSAPFKADEAFTAALDRAGSNSAALRKNFPELQNAEIDSLIDGLKSRGEFEAQPTIEAIKRFRSDASANKVSMDPAKKALGKAQSNIANSLEDLIERNLQVSGDSALLDGYRAARQTLAKTYDVEKALNPASGNVDANALAKALKKGRPLNEELKTIAEFASQFPKANQTIERMGSLPQSSPLDWAAAGAMSAATSNPLLMAGVIARPAARAAVLSAPVQNALARPVTQGRIGNALSNPAAAQLLYRAAPPQSASR